MHSAHWIWALYHKIYRERTNGISAKCIVSYCSLELCNRTEFEMTVQRIPACPFQLTTRNEQVQAVFSKKKLDLAKVPWQLHTGPIPSISKLLAFLPKFFNFFQHLHGFETITRAVYVVMNGWSLRKLQILINIASWMRPLLIWIPTIILTSHM